MAREETELLEMGARIRELRKAHGFKQQWIADQIGVRLRTYQFWQAGESPPEQENLEKLAALFGVTPKYILKGETPELLSARSDQLDQIQTMVEEIYFRVTGEPYAATTAEVVGQLPDRLAETDESLSKKAPAQSPSRPAASRSKRA